MITEPAPPINYPIIEQSPYAIVATNSTKNLPTISLEVSPDRVPEDEDHRIIFKFTRTGDVSKPLIVYYNVSGTAEHKKDYKAYFNDSEIQEIFFPSGVSSVVVEVVPIEDREFEPDESVILKLVPDDSYNLVTLDDVSGVIRGNRAALAWLKYANAAPIAAFATPFALSPWNNGFRQTTTKVKEPDDKEPPIDPKPVCISNCYVVPGPFSVLAIIEGYRTTRKIRTKIKSQTNV